MPTFQFHVETPQPLHNICSTCTRIKKSTCLAQTSHKLFETPSSNDELLHCGHDASCESSQTAQWCKGMSTLFCNWGGLLSTVTLKLVCFCCRDPWYIVMSGWLTCQGWKSWYKMHSNNGEPITTQDLELSQLETPLYRLERQSQDDETMHMHWHGSQKGFYSTIMCSSRQLFGSNPLSTSCAHTPTHSTSYEHVALSHNRFLPSLQNETQASSCSKAMPRRTCLQQNARA